MPEHSEARPIRIAVIGAGKVGSTFAYALLLSGLAAEIVLIDADVNRCEGEAMDLNHTVPFVSPTRVWSGTLDDCQGAAVMVLAAGPGQRPGETRLDLVCRNAEILSDIVPRAAERNPGGIFVVATNPVDILSYVTWKLSGLPHSRVIGSGTVLDTARFRHLLGQHFSVDPRSIHAYVIGEHGDSEVPVWSLANIAGLSIEAFCRETGCHFDNAIKNEIARQTRDAAYQIIDRKGATHYAIGAGLLRIVEAIVRNQHTILSVSTLVSGYYGIEDVYLSLPAIIGSDGAEQALGLGLADEEVAGLKRSASVLRSVVDDLARALVPRG